MPLESGSHRGRVLGAPAHDLWRKPGEVEIDETVALGLVPRRIVDIDVGMAGAGARGAEGERNGAFPWRERRHRRVDGARLLAEAPGAQRIEPEHQGAEEKDERGRCARLRALARK